MITKDKIQHFLAGFIISAIIGLFNSIFGLILAILAGVGKEVYDYVSNRYYQGKHTVDLYDCLATVLGGLIGYNVVHSFNLYVNIIHF